jgi:hypothetical protein
MKPITTLLVLFALFPSAASTKYPNKHTQNANSTQTLHFAAKLEKRVELFNTSGRTLIATVLDLAYEHELPLGIEYIDDEAATKPINVELRNESVRGIIEAIVQLAPEYRVSFSDGLVDIYAPKAREDPSNLLNKIIKNFAVTEMDTHRADMELFCALSREIAPAGGCGGSIAAGQWGPLRITLHLQNATIYEIVNAITAQNGKAVWTVIAPAGNLSKIPVGGLWHIYPLDPPFKDAVLLKLTSIAGETAGVIKE